MNQNKILIVDDSLTIRADLEDNLSDAGFSVLSCASIAQARVLFDTEAIGLVLLDTTLPDGNGVELLHSWRATERGTTLPVLMLSNEPERKEVVTTQVEAEMEYVGKPYKLEHIISRARKFLGIADPAHTTLRESAAKILIIDDSPTFREGFGDALREQGFEVICAESGEEGLRRAVINTPDAIVVDSMLPGIDGPTVIRKLRLDIALRHIPCIMLTGSESFDDELRSLDSGADAFIRKADDLDMMLARVAAVVRNTDKVLRSETSSLLGPKRIMAVDDSMTYLHEISNTLLAEGYEVILARSGEEALELLATREVDCILLDRLMPGMDGTETCRRIKASSVTRDIPLIMLTATEDREAMIEGLSTGADDYVLKSSETDVLSARVRAQLRRKQFEDESRRVRAELMSKEFEAREARAARDLAESRAELLDALEFKNRELEKAIAQLKIGQQAIEERNLQLQQANAMKSEFVSNMSHEIRTPINAIMGFAYLLSQRELDPDSADVVIKIRNAGRTLQSIINDILDFSKIEAGRLEIESTPLRIGDILDTLSDIMAANAGHKDLELVISPPPALGGQLYGDALRIEQILINLTGNAIKFSEHGAVRVDIQLLEQKSDVVTLRFAVIDSGIGIPSENQAQIFDAFRQADSSTTRRFGGTGLGLTICRHLVTMMGGEIGLTSETDKGSEFWFTIPFKWCAVGEFAPAEMRQLDVLIVDDNLMALDNLTRIARSIGWNVTKAETGEMAIQKIRLKSEQKNAFDVVLIDWKMPGMDGLLTARKIHEEFQSSPMALMLMVAAFSRDELSREIGIEVIHGVLCKPVTSSTLYNSVCQVLRQLGRRDMGQLVKSTQPRTKRLAGIRVLVVDDNEINREVALRIIDLEGGTVRLASDGLQALNWMRENPGQVDIVLMDVQMPVMDGYEATRQLRALPEFLNLPVVALTAGAFKAQQETALKAGMNAFVSKPFNVEELIATVLQLTNGKNDGGASDVANQNALETEPEQLELSYEDLPGIAINYGMSVWQDLGLYRKFLHKFSREYGDFCNELVNCLSEGDLQIARRKLHKLKGAAGSLSLIDVVRAALVMECLESTADMSDRLAQLREAIVVALASIEQFSGTISSDRGNEKPSIVSDRPINQLFETLLFALDRDTPDEANRIVESIRGRVDESVVVAIQDRIDNFDFRGAEDIVRQLAPTPS